MEYLSFDDAKQDADDLGLTVSGTYREDGSTVYFLTDPTADEDALHEQAFQIRHGRPLSSAEKFYMRLGKRLGYSA